METLQNILDAEVAQRIGWTLVHFLWQGLAAGLLTGIILRSLKHSSSNTRYLVSLSAMSFMMLVPAVTFPLINIEKPETIAKNTAEFEIEDNVNTVTVETIPEVVIVEQSDQAIALENDNHLSFEAVMPYLALGWITGASILCIWHIGGWFQLQKLRWQTIKPTKETIKLHMRLQAEKLGITKTINIVESALVQVPTVIGHFKPMILLPANIITGISTEQIVPLLAHELAHIKRNDYLVNIIQTIFEILGFFHPVVWWLSKKIRAERENCCDDLAIATTGNKLEYAKSLAKVEEMRSEQYKLAVAASGGNLYSRIRRLLTDEKQNERKTSGIYSAIITLLVIGVIMPGAFALASSKDKSEVMPLLADGVQSYFVNKNVSEFTGPEDFSKPETAYVAINKVMAADSAKGWKRVSVERLSKVFDTSRQPNTNTNWANVVTNAKIHGVIINDTKAVVIAEFLQEFSNTKIIQPIDARYMELENGKWLNTGEDRFDTIEQAKFKFKKIIDKTNNNQGQPKLNSMIEQIDIDNNTREDLLKLFGEPEKYVWGNETFDKDSLPERYIIVYPNHLHVFIMNNSIVELRIEGPGDYVYNNKLKFGSSLETVIEVLGEPDETVVGQPNTFKSKTLYKDIDGTKGHCYYAREDKDIRIWMQNNQVIAIYLTRSNYSDRGFDTNSDGVIAELSAKIARVDIDSHTPADLIRIFGEPKQYLWENKKFSKDSLPSRYIMLFPNNFCAFIMNDYIVELRLEGPSEYVYGDGLKVGSSLEKTIDVLGEPKETVTGQPNTFKSKTLYKDIDGTKGHCYYAREDKNIRIWFGDNIVHAIYLTRSDYSDGGSGKETYTKDNLPEGSYINEDGHLVDKVDYPFESDPEVIGKWTSVDFVGKTESFNPKRKRWGGELFLKSLQFEPSGIVKVENGPQPFSQKWTKGLLLRTTTASKYTIKEIDGETYMFYEWKSGDYTIRHMQPSYYVLKKNDTQTELPAIATNIRIITFPANSPLINNLKFGGLLDIAPDKLDEMLKSTLSNPESKLITAPRIISLNGEKAYLTLANDVPIAQTDGSGQYDYVNIGIKIHLTNTIKDNDNIQSQISITQTELNGNSVSSNATATDILIPEGQTAVISGGQTSDGKHTAILVQTEITSRNSLSGITPAGVHMTGGMGGGMEATPAQITTKSTKPEISKLDQNLDVSQIEFVTDVEMQQLSQGKNILYLHVKNNTDKDQLFAVHVYTRSPDFGPQGVGWGTVFFETIEAGQTKKVKAPFKIQGPVTDNTYIRLKYYNPISELTYDYDNPFHQETLKASQVNSLLAKDINPGKLSKKEAVSDELAKTFAQFQTLIKNKSYEQAWNMITHDYQVSEYQKGGIDRFKKHMEPVHPLDDGFSWKKETFLKMKPVTMKIRGQSAFQNKSYVQAKYEKEQWTIVFAYDDNSWKIDDITGYIPEVINK